MIEFGSDFHSIKEYKSNNSFLNNEYNNLTLMSNGRQCLITLIQKEKWNRIWIPLYYCYDVINTIKEQTDIIISFYPDYPLQDDLTIINKLPILDGDVLLRINYFGLRYFRSNENIPIPIIEDHSHDVRSYWALHSNADWCIASLRKIIPIPEGGMLWSPKGNNLSLFNLKNTKENQQIAKDRWLAMQMKHDYLNGQMRGKDIFRKLYVKTEMQFESAKPSLIDNKSREFINRFDIDSWQEVKHHNWILLRSLISNKLQIIEPENKSCNMFSLIVLFESEYRRNIIRKKLIEHSVYPAILWQVPNDALSEIKNFSNHMLSIHCDGRYNENEIRQLAGIINHSLEL